jgi:hypothetical protein
MIAGKTGVQRLLAPAASGSAFCSCGIWLSWASTFRE